MERQFAILTSVLGMLLIAASASAQTLNVKADVPFSFSVDNVIAPTGTYDIKAMLPASSQALVMTGGETRTSRVVLANAAVSTEVSPNTRLVFHLIDGHYFLHQIWMQGSYSGRQFPISSRERELAKLDLPSQEVIVLASLR